MNLSDKLVFLRRKNKVTAAYVSKKLGIAKSTLSNYEKGIRMPKAEILTQLASLYGVSLSFLFDKDRTFEEELAHYYNHVYKGNSVIPIYGKIDSADFESDGTSVIGYTDLSGEFAGRGEYFAFYVFDDSMQSRRICEGDIAIVRKQESVSDGDVALVMVEGDRAEIKKLYFNEDIVTLMPCSYNSSVRHRCVNRELIPVHIFGRVVEVKIKF